MYLIKRLMIIVLMCFLSTAYAVDKKANPEIEEEKSEPQAIDPSNLTRVYTMVSGWVNSQNNARVTAQWSGSWTENQDFMGFVEGFWGDEDEPEKWGTNLLKVRAQYFHVISTEWKAAPRLGFSFDYIDNPGDNNLTAVGVLGMLPPSVTGQFQVFPNVAYMTGEAEGVDVNGYMLNLYATYPIGNDGTFLQVWPEYISISGAGIDTNSLTLSALYAQPMNPLKTMWLNVRLEHATKETKLNSYFERLKEDETVLTFGFKFYL